MVAVMGKDGKWKNIDDKTFKRDFVGTKPMIITPEVAKSILENHNKKNRKISNDDIIRLAREINSDSFLLSGDSVTFDKEGQLISGQHRLAACVKANRAIEVLVGFGFDDKVRAITDLTRPKSGLSDRKMIMGIDMRTDSMQALDFFIKRRRIQRQISPKVREEFYEYYRKDMEEVANLMSGCRFRHGSIRAAILTAWCNLDKGLVARFIKVFSGGLPDEELGLGFQDPAWYLREWLVENPILKNSEAVAKEKVFRITTACIKNFVNKKPMTNKTKVNSNAVVEYDLPDIDLLLPTRENFNFQSIFSAV
jgi:hypothetical protein